MSFMDVPLRVHQTRGNRKFPKGAAYFVCNEPVAQGQ